MSSTQLNDAAVSDLAHLQKLNELTSLLNPWAVRAAATLRLPDLVAEGADTAPELARQSGTDPDAIGRLMRHLILLGLFRKSDAGRWEVTAVGELLRDGHPMMMRTTLDQENPFLRKLDESSHGLLYAVRAGGSAWPHLHGMSFWDNMAADPGFGGGYDAQMTIHSSMFGPALARSYSWASVQHVVDVGGGAGRTLAALLGAHPHLRGTLVDLPGPTERAAEIFAEFGVADRALVAPQNFLDPLPAGGDVYLVANVIHNWNDAGSVALLKQCAAATRTRGRTLLIERIAPDTLDVDEQSSVSHLDLFMLMTTGGKERSVHDLRQLGAAAGLKLSATYAMADTPWLSLLEYRAEL